MIALREKDQGCEDHDDDRIQEEENGQGLAAQACHLREDKIVDDC